MLRADSRALIGGVGESAVVFHGTSSPDSSLTLPSYEICKSVLDDRISQQDVMKVMKQSIGKAVDNSGRVVSWPGRRIGIRDSKRCRNYVIDMCAIWPKLDNADYTLPPITSDNPSAVMADY